ncbi:hypothetical protein ILP97_00245 [Amycolatopsis sp. H6(2020)]|nr:hypothetical protein [Amycolatopsis sp. H6(2020)]
MAEFCLVPSEVLGPDHPTVPVIAEVVEMLIRRDYCRSKGGCDEFLSPGSRQTDFFDIGMGFSRCRQLAAFLRMHNPSLDTTLIATQCELKKDGGKSFPVPDIITHEPPETTEFYEIKPNSTAGIRAGVDKIRWFTIICDDNLLPYTAGRNYDPDKRITLYGGRFSGSPVRITLHFKRDRPGLLVYEFCADVSRKSVSRAMVENIIGLMIAAMIVFSQGLVLVPVLASITSPMRGTVGAGGSNDANDVGYVQVLLNDWRDHVNLPLIAVDGRSGPRTEGAIRDAQTAIGSVVDGRLDPDGPGISALEQAHLAAIAAGAVDGAGALAEAGGAPADWHPLIETPDEAEQPIEAITEVDQPAAAIAAVQHYLTSLHDSALDLG